MRSGPNLDDRGAQLSAIRAAHVFALDSFLACSASLPLSDSKVTPSGMRLSLLRCKRNLLLSDEMYESVKVLFTIARFTSGG